MTKRVKLTRGLYALVDDADYKRVAAYRWFALSGGNRWYAARWGARGRGKRKTILMQRVILNVPDGMLVYFLNGDGLDNRQANLRLGTHVEALRSQGLRRNNTSGYKGVYWHKWDRRWRAKIWVSGKQKHLGCFATAEEAAQAYKRAVAEIYGDAPTRARRR